MSQLAFYACFALVPAELAELEDRARQEETRGEPARAVECWKQALVKAVELARTDERGFLSAVAEAYAHKLALAVVTTGRSGEVGSLVEGLSRLAKDRDLCARLAKMAMDFHLRSGRPNKAQKLSSELGFVTGWKLIGPFDNERSRGFDVAYEPETLPPEFSKAVPGKKRPVRWRQNPVTPPDGLLDLAAVFTPSEQALAYALSYVHSDRDLDASARLATDDGFKLWVNDALVGENRALRPATFDQDVIPLRLVKGWNKILLKVTQEKVGWEFSFRLTLPDGRKLSGIRFDASEPRETPASPPATDLKIKAGGAVRLKEFLSSPPEDAGKEDLARVWYYLGVILRARHAHGVMEHPDREAFARATELDPENPYYFHELSTVSVDWSLMRSELDENGMRVALERAAALDPSFARASCDLGSYYLRSFLNTAKAFEFTRSALASSPEYEAGKLLRAEVYEARGWDGLALAEMKETEASSPSLNAKLRLARALEEGGRFAEAHQLYAAALRMDMTSRAASGGVVTTAKALGRLHVALKELERRAAYDPYDYNAHVERAKLCEAKDDYAGATRELKLARKIRPDDHEILFLLGRCLDWVGKREEARSSWEEAEKLHPNYVELNRYLDFLGRPEPPEEAFKADADELIERERSLAPPPGVSAVRILDERLDKVNADGTSSRQYRLLVRILKSRAARAYRTHTVNFVSGEQDVRIEHARVHRPDGTVEEAAVAPESSRSTAYGTWLARTVVLPALHEGDIVDFKYRIDDTMQSFFGDYYGTMRQFRWAEPTRVARYVLVVPEGKHVSIHSTEEELKPEVRRLDDGRSLYVWEKKDAPRLDTEPWMPSSRALAPQVHVSTFADWKAFGRWYWHLIRHTQQTSPELEETVRRLTEGCETDVERIRRLYSFVTTDVTYVAWEFGVHGFKPYRASKVFKQRFGDCKDKSILLKTMLGVLGIESHPALLRATFRRSEEDLSLPIIGHFNHCILYVPPAEGRGEMWLDGTSDRTGLDEDPVTNAGALSAVITPEGAEVKRIPEVAARENAIEDAIVGRLDPDGSLSFSCETRAKGWVSSVFRRYYGLKEPEARSQALGRLLSEKFAGAEISMAVFGDLADISQPLFYRYHAELPMFAKRSAEGGLSFSPLGSMYRGAFGGVWQLAFPKAFAPVYASMDRRKTGLELVAPWRYSCKAAYDLPDGFVAKRVPGDMRVENEFGLVSRVTKREGRKLVVETELELRVRRVAPSDYPAFRSFCLVADRAELERFELAPEAGR